MIHQSVKWIFLIVLLVACKQPGQNNPSSKDIKTKQNNPSSKEAGKTNDLRGKKKITLADIDTLTTFDGSCDDWSTRNNYICYEYYYGNKNLNWGCSPSKNKCRRKGNRGYAVFDDDGMTIHWFPHSGDDGCQLSYRINDETGDCTEISQD